MIYFCLSTGLVCRIGCAGNGLYSTGNRLDRYTEEISRVDDVAGMRELRGQASKMGFGKVPFGIRQALVTAVGGLGLVLACVYVSPPDKTGPHRVLSQVDHARPIHMF